MTSRAKTTFYRALTALQIAPENGCDSNVFSPDQQTLNSSEVIKSKTLSRETLHDAENVKPTFSRSTVGDHCFPDSCWIIINNEVYDVTRFLRMHPGGDDIILEYGGRDASTAFIDKGHSRGAYDCLADYLIGEITEEDRWPEKRIS